VPFTTAALTSEIQADPMAYGYAAFVAAGNDRGIADALNLVRAGASYKVDVGVIDSYLIVSAIIPAELATRTSAQISQLQLLTGAGRVDTAHPNVQAQFQAIFDAATAPVSRAALIALAKRQGSRAEQLFGTKVTLNQVAAALGRF